MHLCTIMLEQERAIPKLFLQSSEHEIVQKSAEETRAPFNGIKGPSAT